TQMLDNAYANGYAGVMFWSYNSDFGWEDAVGPLKTFRDANAGIVDYVPGDAEAPGAGVSSIEISGTASDAGSTPTVTVGGTEVPLVAGTFSAEAALGPLPQAVVITATDASSNSATVEVAVSQ
ncbi:MAG: hypothetical protein JW909_13000, partial [Planctomycetes bacterium]|nr:hypothetical protein [Planctomycetota bacterium]